MTTVFTALAGVLAGALAMALVLMRCPFCRRLLSSQIDAEATKRFQSLAARYDEADRAAMDAAIEARRLVEEEYKLVAESAECILWHATVKERESRDLDWDLRVFAEERGDFVSIHDVPMDYRTGAWYHGRQEEDMFRLAEQATNAICSDTPGYRQEFQCLSKTGEPVWFQEDARIIKTGPKVWRLFGVSMDITDRKKAEEQREKLVKELQDALAQVKQLRGMLPICANCKKIRDDGGYWNQIESYFKSHADVEFSHGLCPDCMYELYPELAEDVAAQKAKIAKKPESLD